MPAVIEIAMKAQGMFTDRHLETDEEPKARIVIELPDNPLDPEPSKCRYSQRFLRT